MVLVTHRDDHTLTVVPTTCRQPTCILQACPSAPVTLDCATSISLGQTRTFDFLTVQVNGTGGHKVTKSNSDHNSTENLPLPDGTNATVRCYITPETILLRVSFTATPDLNGTLLRCYPGDGTNQMNISVIVIEGTYGGLPAIRPTCNVYWCTYVRLHTRGKIQGFTAPTPYPPPNLTNPPPGLHMPCQNKTAWHAIWCRGKTFIFAHIYIYFETQPLASIANLAVNP